MCRQSEASLSCISELTCEALEALGCEETLVAEFMTCEGNVDVGPSIVAFCEAQTECNITEAVCQLAFLEDFMRGAYDRFTLRFIVSTGPLCGHANDLVGFGQFCRHDPQCHPARQ